jgi:hypothetical protein
MVSQYRTVWMATNRTAASTIHMITRKILRSICILPGGGADRRNLEIALWRDGTS